MTCKDCIHQEVCGKRRQFTFAVVDERCKTFTEVSRVVELPCKIGDTVYAIVNPHTRHSSIATVPFCVSLFDGFGKYYFLTREEAEKALKENEKEW